MSTSTVRVLIQLTRLLVLFQEPAFATIVPYEEAAADPTASSIPDARRAQPSPVQNGHTNGHANGLKQGIAGGAAAPASCKGEGVIQWVWGRVSRPFVGAAAVPVVPRAFSTGSGEAALHGVVHQITAEEMRQIQRTEGGGSSFW